MNKGKLVSNVSKKSGFPRKVCELIINYFITEMGNAMIGGENVSLPGFASFAMGVRKERLARNPSTGEIVTFPEVKTVKCRISKELRNAINGRQ